MHAAAMRRRGFIAYGAGLIGITLFTAPTTINSLVFVYCIAGGITALGAVGWLIACCGPIALSALVWVLDRRIRARWLPHLVFVPAAIAVFRFGASLYFRESGVWASSMISDLAMITALGYLALALLVHIAALTAFGITGVKRWTNDR